MVLRCEDMPLRGLLADNVYQDLVHIADADERERHIIAAAKRQSQAAPLPPSPFTVVPPRIGGLDAGKVDWHPSVLEEARKTGLSVDDGGKFDYREARC